MKWILRVRGMACSGRWTVFWHSEPAFTGRLRTTTCPPVFEEVDYPGRSEKLFADVAAAAAVQSISVDSQPARFADAGGARITIL